MKERTVGKENYSVGETVRLQNIKTKKWDVFAVSYTHLTLPTNREV